MVALAVNSQVVLMIVEEGFEEVEINLVGD